MKSTTPCATLALALSVTAAAAVRSRAASGAVRRAFGAWSTGEGSIYDLMDAGTEIVIPGTTAHCGTYRKDEFLREVAAPFVARFAEPPIPRLRALWTNRDSVVAQAEATGVTHTGQAYANAYIFAFEMSGRRVRRVTEFLDMVAFNTVWDGVEPAKTHAG